MKRRFTILTAALALLAFLAIPMGMRGQTTVDVTLSSGSFNNNVITWTCADGNIIIQQLKGSGSSNPNSSYISAPRVYKQNILSFVGNNGYTITNIDIKCDGSYTGTTKYAGTEISNNNVDNNSSALTPTWSTSNGGTHSIATVSSDGLSEIYIQNGHSSDNNIQLRITKLTITYKVTGSVTATTVTINTDGLTNTDVYTSTTAGTLTASVTETGSGNAISGATVTWSSSDTDVATIDNSGAVTLVAVGTTTITASYAGESGVYGTSSATYTLTVTSSAPYVQPTTIEIIPNYTFWGKTGQFSGSTYSELNGSQDNVSLHWTRGEGSTYANTQAMRFYKDNELTFTAPEGYEIISIVLTVSGTYSDLTFSPTGYDNTTTTWTGAAGTVTMSRPSDASSYATISKFTITLASIGSAVTTTTTITVPANFNTDIYQSTTAGTLTATVKDNENNTISGASVTWTSSNTGVATIDAYGAVTLGAVGTTTITASYAGVEGQYRPSSDTYELEVTDGSPLANIAALTAQTEAGNYYVTLTNALVTYVNGTNAYLEDASGAVLLYHCAGTLAAGNKITGTANVTYTVYNDLPEVTAIELAAGCTLTSGNTVTPVVVTIAELNSNFTSYISRYVKIENATVTSAFSNRNCTIEQNGSSIILRDQNNPGTLSTTANSTVTVTAHPSIYNTTKQIAVYEQSQIVVSPTVYISADDVNITSSATSGSITYTIENEPSPAGTLTATVVAGYTISNLSLAAPSNGTIGFTCDANTTTTARTAEITLVYTYGSKAQVTKTITVTQNAYVPTPSGGNYVRITSLDQLTDGSIVVFAARYDEEHTNGYYAMPGVTSGKPDGVAFTSETFGTDEVLPATITASEDTYYWTVNVTENGYTFTNANGQMIGYSSSTNFATNNHTVWTITRETAENSAMVAEYTGFVIRNGNTNSRAFSFNGTAFGAYSTSNMNAPGYNFFLDFFVQTSTPVTEPITIPIAAWTTDQNGVPGNWYLITSPLADPIIPTAVGNMIPENLSNVDLYRFDQNANLEWVNYRTLEGDVNTNFGNLIAGTGYLYANANDVQLEFTGTPYSGDGVIQLRYYTNNQDSNMHGVNLIGNPFNVETTIGDQDFYRMNPEGRKEIVLAYDENNTNPSIAPMEGIFVHATGEGESVTFTPSDTKATRVVERTWIELCQNNLVVDRASIRYGEGTPLPKIQLNENNTKIYFPMEDGDYAVIIGDYQDEVPLNFMAATAGTYTLNFTNQNAEFNTLILVDNQTNTQVNLLNNPSYSFSAQTTDDEARFTVVYQRASSYLTIGTGDLYSASGNNSSDSTKDGMGSPVGNTYYTASTAQFIYMASEMEGAKTIRSLAFYHNNQGPFVGTVKIYLAHTSASQVYTSNPATSGTLVYEGTNINIGSSSAGWQTFTLDTPFPYNGTDNLLVVVCRTKATSGSPNYHTDQGWKYTSYSQHYYYMQRSGNGNDTYGNITTTGNYARGFKRPNIKIGYTAPTVNHFYLDIDGWTSSRNNYYLIASPIGQVAPTAVDNMLSNTYDLFYFDQDGDDEGYEWMTYKPGNGATDPGFDLVPGKGYLYANSGVAGNNPNVVTLTFTGWGYTGSGQVDLIYSEANSDSNMHGWNLVGNPFGVEAYIDRPFYRMNEEGSELNGESETGSIGIMEGVFVYTTQNETMTFTTTPSGSKGSMVALNLSKDRKVIDRAIVRFGEGKQLPKFQLNRNNTKLYIPQDNKDYAIVCAEEQGEMPVSFKAEDNGIYNLNFSTENVEFAYLHLIDNMTGTDVDLLQTPSYSFEAKTTDYASRFKLVFATGDNSTSDTFAFFSNGSFVINNEGNATLQVIDVTGRILKSESINGCANVDVNAAPGVYILRLVNGENVKVQKVVVK